MLLYHFLFEIEKLADFILSNVVIRHQKFGTFSISNAFVYMSYKATPDRIKPNIWDTIIRPPHGKTNKMTAHPAKAEISLGIRHVWSESSLCTQWVAKDSSFLHADSEDSDPAGQIPRLIWVFSGGTCHFVGFVMRLLICFIDTLFHIAGSTCFWQKKQKPQILNGESVKNCVGMGITEFELS